MTNAPGGHVTFPIWTISALPFQLWHQLHTILVLNPAIICSRASHLQYDQCMYTWTDTSTWPAPFQKPVAFAVMPYLHSCSRLLWIIVCHHDAEKLLQSVPLRNTNVMSACTRRLKTRYDKMLEHALGQHLVPYVDPCLASDCLLYPVVAKIQDLSRKAWL